MSFHHRVLASGYHPVAWGKSALERLGLTSPHRLRVMLYHDVAPQDQARLEVQLRWLARSWKFVPLERFEAMVLGDEPVRGRNLLLTFDDGFASNRIVAEEVLAPLGIHALFFVVSDFVAIVDRDEARRFIACHIHPGSRVDEVPRHLYNMGWSDLDALLEQGHSIGAHTRTHARLSKIAVEPDLEREIAASGDRLEKQLGIPIDHFAYPFGDLASFTCEALAMARQRFRFVHTGLRGGNAKDSAQSAVWRDSVTARDSNALLGAYLEGLSDPWYAGARSKIRGWA